MSPAGFAPDALYSRLESYLNGDGPVGVAVSGGGDSLALLRLLAAWGKRPLEVFCVDHGLNPDARAWSAQVAAAALSLGAGFTGLVWQGDKPVTGLAAAARQARHCLLARAARAKGCRVICLGHTADDVIEARLMRAQGSSVTPPHLWSPSPVWPEGRGLFLLRPLLETRRAALRDWLRDQGLSWIDDPANIQPSSLRARVRSALNAAQAAPQPSAATQGLPEGVWVRDAEAEALGMLVFDAARIFSLPKDEAVRLLATAAVCAGGGVKLPRRDQVVRALEGLKQMGGKPLSLCGARLWRDQTRLMLAREAGEMRRHGIAELEEADALVWDGRFLLRAPLPEKSAILASATVRSRLSDAERRKLRLWPASVRATLPVIAQGQEMRLAVGPDAGSYGMSCLVAGRFAAAIGQITSERDLDDGK